MSVRRYTTEIPGTECLGDSRSRINTSFLNLDTAVSALSTGYNSLLSAVRNINIDIPDFSNVTVTVQAGDGILVNNAAGSIGTNRVTVAAHNSIQQVRYGDFSTVAGTSIGTVNNYRVDDGTTLNLYRFPFNASSPPAVTFDSVSLGTKVPTVTLYWVASAQRPITVYATNSAVNANHLGRTAPNDTVLTADIDGNLAYLGGRFTSIRGLARRRFGIINLAGGANTSLGPAGDLDSALGNQVGNAEVARQYLNSVGSAGFNDVIHAIKVFTINNRKYLCVGGSFTNVPVGVNTGATQGQRFAIFEITEGYRINHTYTFNGAVLTMLSAGNFLYLGGDFTSGRRNDVGATNIPMKGLTRINMETLAIDVVFTENATNPATGIFAAASIRTIAFSNNLIYTGGNHTARIGRGNNTTHQNLMAHTLDGRVYRQWEPITNGLVANLKVDTVRDTLYVVGLFTRYRTYTTTDVVRNYALALNIDRNSSTPTIYNNWAPNFDSYVTCVELHNENDTTSPVYLAGQFSTVDGQACDRLVALTKPETGGVAQYLSDWRPSINSTFCIQSWVKPGIIRIPSTSSLAGLFVHGTFITIAGTPRNYFARITGRLEGPVPPLSTVRWTVAGGVLAEGSELAINVNQAVTVTDSPIGFGTVNKTIIPMPASVFQGINRGDYCRYLIRRNGAGDTYQREVWLLGASVDYSPAGGNSGLEYDPSLEAPIE